MFSFLGRGLLKGANHNGRTRHSLRPSHRPLHAEMLEERQMLSITGPVTADYAENTSAPGAAVAVSTVMISDETGGGPDLDYYDRFGSSVASIGDLNGDGVEDMAVGAFKDDTGGTNYGAVYVLFMEADGTVGSSQKIACDTGGGPSFTRATWFGYSVSSIGDLNGDGVIDLAVGAVADRAEGSDTGALYVLFMNPDGTVQEYQKITSDTAGGPTLTYGDHFGGSISAIGDLDGDGVLDLAVGAKGDDTDGSDCGAVYILFMNTDGTVRESQKVANETGGGPTLNDVDQLGWSLASMGDMNGDGVTDLAVGALRDGTGGDDRGAVYVLFMNSDGTVESYQKIASDTSGGPTLPDGARFGDCLASLGDLDGDGVTDLAVGAIGDSSDGLANGAVHVLLMNADGTVKSSQKIADSTHGGPAMTDGDHFGISVAALGDLDGDGVTELAAGASRDTASSGEVYVLFLAELGELPTVQFDNTTTTLAEDTDTTSGVKVADIVVTDGYSGSQSISLTGTDAESFEVVGTELHLKAGLALDYETQTQFEVTVTVDDPTAGPTPDDTASLTVSVADVNEPMTVTLENTTTTLREDTDTSSSIKVADIVVTDNGIGAEAVTLSGDDAALFEIVEAELYLKAGVLVDFETNPQLDVVVEVDNPTFGTSPDDTAPLSIAITDVNEPTVTLENATTTLAEDADTTSGVKVADVVTTNEGQGTLELTLTGADAELFEIDGTSLCLKAGAYLDYETNATLDVVIEADNPTFGASPDDTVALAITVTDVVEIDFGDAPDTSSGTSEGNYNTLASDNGPSHMVVAGLRLGGYLDGEEGTLQNAKANADDVDSALPDDEDGLNSPATDLVLTVGTQPTVNAVVTNTTGTPATLYGWIDYNGDGVFDNATERAEVTVADGATSGVVTLTFPTVPSGFTGETYARFRLSTDDAAADPTGAAADGEVEDYVATINLQWLGELSETVKITDGLNGGPDLARSCYSGLAVASLGDLDGDGVTDLAVGAYGDTYRDTDDGLIHVLFMNADGTVKSWQKISSGVGGGPTLASGDHFGSALCAVGDLNGDGVIDLAVGAEYDDTGVSQGGSVYILFMATDGTVQSYQEITTGLNGGPPLVSGDAFGADVSALGDLDGDGVTELAVSAYSDDTAGAGRGAVYVMFMNADGTAKSYQKITDGTGGGPTLDDYSYFGRSVGSLGDLNEDGVPDLAVGSDGENFAGAVHVLFMNSDGTVKSSQTITRDEGGGPNISPYDYFGCSITSLGDLNGDGVTDLAVGAKGDDMDENITGPSIGAAYVLLMNSDGTVESWQKIDAETENGAAIDTNDNFGSSITALGDLNEDGITDLAVGAPTDGTAGAYYGAVHIVFLTPDTTLELTGTSGSDTIVIQPGTPGGAMHEVTINGTVTSYDAAVYDRISMDGLGGKDTITIVGADQDETASLAPGSATVVGDSYQLDASNIESIVLNTGDGKDNIAMVGSSNANRLYSYSTYSLLRDSARTFSFRVEGFETLTVDGSAGASDYACLYDSAGQDRLVADAEQAVLTRNWDTKEAQAITATGFERVYAYATAESGDTAALTGGTDTRNRFYSYSNSAFLTETYRSFYLYTRGFDAVTAESASGEIAYAYIYDSPGADVLAVTADSAQMDRAIGSDTTATGFARVYAYGTQGDSDSASLVGVEDAANRLYSYASYSVLSESSRSLYVHARHFDSTTAESPGDGNSCAYFYDSSENDTLTASPATVTMDRATGWSDTTATGFQRVRAYSMRGGDDTATLTGSEAGGNIYRGYSTSSIMTDSASSFYFYVSRFHSVTAVGSQSDSSMDRAYLYDSSGDDILDAAFLEGDTYQGASLTDASGDYEKLVKYFDLVYARSTDRNTNDTIAMEDEDLLSYQLIRYGTW